MRLVFSPVITYNNRTCGSLAQLVEQRLEEPCVLGSSPRGATRKYTWVISSVG